MNADARPDTVHRDCLTEPERFGLELRWYEGRMLLYVEWLIAFVSQHRDEIMLVAARTDTAGLLAATKRVIAQRGSIHLVGELKDQRREIENELWYRGEKGDIDRRGVSLDWTIRHASAWRRWRIQEYLFVADRCVAQVVGVLRAPAHDDPDSASG